MPIKTNNTNNSTTSSTNNTPTNSQEVSGNSSSSSLVNDSATKSTSPTNAPNPSAIASKVVKSTSSTHRPYNNSQSHSHSRSSNNGSMQNNRQMSEPFNVDTIKVSGVLEILPDYGVLRQKDQESEYLPKDVYVSTSQIKSLGLRMGDQIDGYARPPHENERYLSMLKIEKIDGMDPESAKKRPLFSRLTPIFPNEWIKLETEPEVLSTRIIDLFSPIGKGQRAMIVAPPKAGKTWLLQDIAKGITTNYPDLHLMVVLIGERPEEVTHMARTVKGEIYSSNFDETAEAQTKTTEIALERAKRLAEKGKDVVILMDSLTRLARAYNLAVPPSGRTLSGGFDPSALYPPKHFFGAARNFEEGGSLTIIATALVETGSKMDDVIFEEFKGTGNMELRLARELAERRIFPAIDIKASGTRHEELLYDKKTQELLIRLRRMIDLLEEKESTELVLERLKKTKSNKDFLETLHKGV